MDDPGARVENFVACHLSKAVDYWNDVGLGSFKLHYVRDKEKREVDFLVLRDRKPWMLLEVKSSSLEPLSPALTHFQNQLGAPIALQVAFDAEFVEVDCSSFTSPVIVPMQTFLSQLP